ncbi:MAG: hypothetical protein IIA85_03035 [Nanoarchaeota archaeon]|nr:hypothetical protein [Nanoarchaeota archaeon]
MDYNSIRDAYRPKGESYIRNLYETAKESYDKFVKRSREITQSLLGNYGGDSGGYMGKMPPRDQRVQEYFS